MLVVDASAAVAALTDDGVAGHWARELAVADRLASVELMPFEVANVLRRATLQGRLAAGLAAIALHDLRRMTVQLARFDDVADRSWELRANLTIYDASYVALAESLGADLVTLDARLARAPGIRCRVLTPPAS